MKKCCPKNSTKPTYHERAQVIVELSIVQDLFAEYIIRNLRSANLALEIFFFFGKIRGCETRI